MIFFPVAGLRLLRLAALSIWATGCCWWLSWRLRSYPAERATWLRAIRTHEFAKGAARLLGMRLRVFGKPPKHGNLWVANHLGYLDIISLAASHPVLFVCKSEVADWPVLGIFARLSGSLFLERGNSRAARRMSEHIEFALAQGHNVVLFPEGTSTDGKQVLPFKAALFDAASRGNYPVQPVAIRYRMARGDAGESLAWHGAADFVPHFWRMLEVPGFIAQVKFNPNALIDSDRRCLAAQSHAAILGLLHRHPNQEFEISSKVSNPAMAFVGHDKPISAAEDEEIKVVKAG